MGYDREYPPPHRENKEIILHYSPKISVVIPIYNVAPYLKECLDSVINQTYQNLQIILVNDGSTDESEDIAKEYLNDGRIELICTENGGLSRARNIGLSRANGKYIYFIDSDDYIDLNFLEEMVGIAIEYNIELVCNEQIVYFDERSTKVQKPCKMPEILVPNTQNIMIGGSVWRCLFTQELVKRSGVRFIEGKIYEDEGFLYMIFPFCKQFALYCGKPYYYRQRQGSIINSNKNFRSYDLLDIFEAIYVFYKENGLLSRFDPPYFFLYDCAIGYNNEKEYLKKARELEKKLQIPKNSFVSSQYVKVSVWLKKIISLIKRTK